MLFTVLNSRSVRNKTVALKGFSIESDIDILALTKTWLSNESDDELIVLDICSTGYEFYNVARGFRGGGVGLLYKKRIRFQKQSCIKAKFSLFEFTDLLLKQGSSSLRVVVVYHPPKADLLFFEEFPTLSEAFVTAIGFLLMVEDFNFHVQDSNNRTVLQLLQPLKTFSLV